ncbi:hypothetical protein P3X46_031281 [Hevea brasiliensis]|uniref:Uncharacterized protein n=1 Tax=Hevea brasiliensis TaxID=3981 RepID=A0ABQ9KKS9_HEVBR|nr:uncharacterized protein LOC110652605 [Hevea brasiliensis]KAJ9140662.1 hypothetical protein P3X46_031281 [Hevea brasiliensis]
MENKPSSFLIICSFLLFLVLHSVPQVLAARKLLDIFPNGYFPPGTAQVPPPTPETKVNYNSETKNGSHAQVVSVNGKTRSESGTVNGKNGHPVVQANTHNGYEAGTIKGFDGKPIIQGKNTTDYQTAIINGSDGKPKFEVHRYNNGTAIISVLGSDGKPIYQINSLPPPGGIGNSFLPPPANSYNPFPPPQI